MIAERLTALRNKMKENGVDAYIIPLGDPHQSEYPASHWKIIPWISGFTGSAGTVMISLNHAGLWTDSRYFIQADQELADNEFELHKMNVQHHAGYIDWLCQNLAANSRVIVDGPMVSLAQRDKFETALAEKEIKLEITNDFVSDIWADRPNIPLQEVFEHPELYAGKSRTAKIEEVRNQMKAYGSSHHLITTLDDIAWLLNLRGSDVECNPVFVSFCLLSESQVYLFADRKKFSDSLSDTLRDQGISILPYADVSQHLKQLRAEDVILIDKSTINVLLFDALEKPEVISKKLISRHLKAIKNAVEQEHFREVMIKDAVALTHAFYWLENTVKERTVSEYEFANKLSECRSQQEHYFGESFSAIVGYKGNGAIIHYRPPQEGSAEITNDGILLVDSGGQYMNGTTDITRTISFTTPPPKQKNAYTRVLKGHIALAVAKFPEGTNGSQLDLLARHSLWQEGMNYGHGTGHGVGFFLNVHEPPQGFAPGTSGRAVSVQKAGMVTSNEPGHYVANEYGIRIENLVITQKAKEEGFLEFETITLFPKDTGLIDFSLLTKSEVDWLNVYHKRVYDSVSPLLDELHREWLKDKCKPV